MQQSSRFPLAVHVLVALSFRPDDFISSDSLSGTCKTNPVVVRRVVSSLRRSGIVVSQAGVTGGVKLAKPAKQISLLAVYQALGSSDLFRMHKPNQNCPIGKRIPDALAEFLPAAEKAFEKSLAQASVEDVARKVWPAFFAKK